MELSNSFTKFLKEIRPTDSQKNDYKKGHKTLRERIHADKDLSPIIVSSFLQGSYKRSTAIRPCNDKRADVDIIIVTKLSKDEYTPDKAMDLFVPFLDKWYSGKYRKQGRSFGIELSYVDMDLVITSAPSEEELGVYQSDAVTFDDGLDGSRNWRLVKSWAPEGKYTESMYKSLLTESRAEEEWKTEPLLIPDREKKTWEPTHPLEQIKWTQEKNAKCNSHYINVVKALKWWQVGKYSSDRPKGYPLEHLIGICCPDGINSVAEGIAKVLEKIKNEYHSYYLLKAVPFLSDHGVPSHNVLGRVKADEFQEFYEHVVLAHEIAQKAFNEEKPSKSSEEWRKLLGEKFPLSTEDDDDNSGRNRGPFVPASPKEQTGDLAPRKYGNS